jgi:hypothetical protein
VHKGLEGLAAAGCDLKLGAGGIREIEFYVQTQQLILGGRDPGLRSPRTLDALEALRAAGQVSDAAAAELTDAYDRLRRWEHRVQMVNDEQTHRLPEDAGERLRVAALSGFAELATFDAEVEGVLARVNTRLRRAVRGGGAAVLRLRQPDLHRRGGRPGDAADAGAHGLWPAGAGVGHDPRLAPRADRGDADTEGEGAVHPLGAPIAGGGARDGGARRGVRALRRLLPSVEFGGAAAVAVPGAAAAVPVGGGGDGVCA